VRRGKVSYRLFWGGGVATELGFRPALSRWPGGKGLGRKGSGGRDWADSDFRPEVLQGPEATRTTTCGAVLTDELSRRSCN